MNTVATINGNNYAVIGIINCLPRQYQRSLAYFEVPSYRLAWLCSVASQARVLCGAQLLSYVRSYVHLIARFITYGLNKPTERYS